MKRGAALSAMGVVVVAIALAFTLSCQKLKARDNLNKGVQAFKNAQYSQAEDFFKTAVDLDPTFSTARLYLATAYMMQWIPGAESPENTKKAQAALEQFQEVLKQDPKEKIATASIASIYFNEKNWNEAEKWNKKSIELDPNSKEAYYTLGVIAWSKWYKPWAEARAKLGMQPEDPGPIKDKKVREELRSQYLGLLDEGIKNLQHALDIDKQYDDAMAYMNLLIRERADLDETSAEYKKDTEVADNWVQKTLQTKKVKAETSKQAGGITAQ